MRKKPLPRHNMALHCLCPHCKTPASIRGSREITPLVRRASYECRNPACGHSFVVHVAVTRTLSPSAKPNPAIYLPIAEVTRSAIAQHPSMSEDESGPAVRLLAALQTHEEDRHMRAR